MDSFARTYLAKVERYLQSPPISCFYALYFIGFVSKLGQVQQVQQL
jgi:hypothetical protein